MQKAFKFFLHCHEARVGRLSLQWQFHKNPFKHKGHLRIKWMDKRTWEVFKINRKLFGDENRIIYDLY